MTFSRKTAHSWEKMSYNLVFLVKLYDILPKNCFSTFSKNPKKNKTSLILKNVVKFKT